jgi:hypothetical protein
MSLLEDTAALVEIRLPPNRQQCVTTVAGCAATYMIRRRVIFVPICHSPPG